MSCQSESLSPPALSYSTTLDLRVESTLLRSNMSEDQSTTTLAPSSNVEKAAPVSTVPEVRPSPGESRKYSHGCEFGLCACGHGLISCIVFDPEMAVRRKVVLTILTRVVVLSILVMWTCLPLYWGSCELVPAPAQTKLMNARSMESRSLHRQAHGSRDQP